VRVNGSHAVLMTILKAGSVSTLDVISGVKRLLPQIRASLPPGLTLSPIGDQSVFVLDAVSGVIREGVIAAALTGLMILVFLGSWRSTLIITVSIPLAILASLATLSALGQTINVMTLGGLALAVGILVDDATVTIENINWHLEQGKEIETAILDGAEQIVVPATVSLLCICIVFVPMFTLGGVAGFLFRPLAEAVVFAMIASYVLSRTLVPTMASFLLRGQGHHEAAGEAAGHGHGAQAPPTRNPLVLFQRGFERNFGRLAAGYRGLLVAALALRWRFVTLFLLVVVASFGLVGFLGRDFFPPVEADQIRIHLRAQTGTRIEETAMLCDQVERAIRGQIPPADLGNVVDNIGLPISGINMAYSNSGTIGSEDADILISLKPGHGAADEIVDRLRDVLPRGFTGTSFAFLPADIVTQILNFGLPAPIDVQVSGPDQAANRRYADELLGRISHVAGVADPRLQQRTDQPTLEVAVNRSFAGEVGLTERDTATTMLDTLAGSIQTAPTFWLNPRTGVSYPIVVQTPQYNIDTLGGLRNLPITARGGSQPLGALAQISQTSSDAVVSHYNVRPVLDLYAAIHGRDLGGVTSDIDRILRDTAHDLPRGASVVLRGQVTTMTAAYSQLFAGLAFAVVLVYLLIVVNFQSWLDPFVIVTALPAALAGIVWLLFVTGTTLSVPALTGAIMCMGVATANSILVVSFAREQLAAGLSPLDAALEAGFGRFRPMLMTALAMIIGMLPMALSAEQNAPLGRAVIGGLACATLATLFFVPVVFSIAHGRKAPRASPARSALVASNAP